MDLQFNVENKLLKRTDINKIMPRATDVVANFTFDELVKVTPTDINIDANGNLILEHDVVEISNKKKLAKFKTFFGDMTLYGDGNIDLYRHFITLNDTIYLEYLSSNNLTADSLQDLTTVTKASAGYGFLTI